MVHSYTAFLCQIQWEWVKLYMMDKITKFSRISRIPDNVFYKYSHFFILIGHRVDIFLDTNNVGTLLRTETRYIMNDTEYSSIQANWYLLIHSWFLRYSCMICPLHRFAELRSQSDWKTGNWKYSAKKSSLVLFYMIKPSTVFIQNQNLWGKVMKCHSKRKETRSNVTAAGHPKGFSSLSYL